MMMRRLKKEENILALRLASSSSDYVCKLIEFVKQFKGQDIPYDQFVTIITHKALILPYVLYRK